MVNQPSDRISLCEQAEHPPCVICLGSLGRGDDHRAEVREQGPPVRADMDLHTDEGERGHSLPLQGRGPLPNPARHRAETAAGSTDRPRESNQHGLADRTQTSNRLSKIPLLSQPLYLPSRSVCFHQPGRRIPRVAHRTV